MFLKVCEICEVKSGDLLMAKFPLDKLRCKQWVKAVGKKDLVCVPIETLHAVRYICVKHFKPTDFKKTTELNEDAVPTLHMTREPLPDDLLQDFPVHAAREMVTIKSNADLIPGIFKDHNYCQRNGPEKKIIHHSGENEALFHKWLQNYQDPALKNPLEPTKQSSAMKEKVNELKSTDREDKPVDVRKCTRERPTTHTSSDPVYILQKKKIDGKEKPAIIILQRINSSSPNKLDHVPLVTEIKTEDPLECPQENQEGIINSTETTDSKSPELPVIEKLDTIQIVDVNKIKENDLNILAPEIVQKESLPKVTHIVDTIDLTKTNYKIKKNEYEVISKNVFKHLLNHTLKTVSINSEERPSNISKSGTEPVLPNKPLQTAVEDVTLAENDVVEDNVTTNKVSEFEACKVPEGGVPGTEKPEDVVPLFLDIKSNTKNEVFAKMDEWTKTKTAANVNSKNEQESTDVVNTVNHRTYSRKLVPIPAADRRRLASALVMNQYKRGTPSIRRVAAKPATKTTNNTPVAAKPIIKVVVPVKCSPGLPAVKNTGNQGKLPLATKADQNRLSQKYEGYQNRVTVQKTLSDSLNAAQLHRLPYEESRRMRSLIVSYHDHYGRLKLKIQALEKQVETNKVKMAALKRQLSYYKSNHKFKALERITNDMTEDAKTLIRMQVLHYKKKPKARRYNLKEKLFSLALYKLSRPAYRYMSCMLPMPSTKTLNNFLNDLHSKLLVEEGVAPDKNLQEINKNTETDNIPLESKSGEAIGNNLEEIDETATAVAAISSELETEHFVADQSMVNIGNTTTSEEIEYSADQNIYPNIEVYADEGYIQTDCTNFNSYSNDIVNTTQYVHQRNEQSSNIIEIPSNHGPITISNVGKQDHRYALPKNPYNLPQQNVKIPKNNNINPVSKSTITKTKLCPSTLSDDKKAKIDFVLLKLMTPDQLKSLAPKPKKKYVKKKNIELKKIKTNRVVSGATRVSNSNLKMKRNKNVGNITKQNRNLKKIMTSLCNLAQTNAGSMQQNFIPQYTFESQPLISDRHNLETNVLGTNTSYNTNLQQNLQSLFKIVQSTVGDLNHHIPEMPLKPVRVIANEDNSELDVMDTVTKLRRNIEKYSPDYVQGKDFLEGANLSQGTLGSELNAQNSLKKKDFPKTPIGKKTVKRKRKLVDELAYDPSREYSRPEMFVYGTRDEDRRNIEVNRNQPHNSDHSYKTQESNRSKGFDMPDLNENFKSSFGSKKRVKFGYKRVPPNPY